MKQIGFLILLVLLIAPAFAQSTNENFPTPVLQNEVTGKIAARDLGDARLTRYFYVFQADNGDVNLEVETVNFDGDLDLFEGETGRPLAKITIVADASASKTNRQIYFRKRAQVVLRIEGRSLVDDAATYRIAFSGSFVAATDLPQYPVIEEPKVAVKPNAEATAKVNSAGAIVEVATAEKPLPIETDAKPSKDSTAAIVRRPPRKTAIRPKPTAGEDAETFENAPKIETSKAEKTALKPLPKIVEPKNKQAARTVKPTKTSTAQKSVAKKDVSKNIETVLPTPDPLASIELVILLKNGDRVARMMSEIFNVSVDKGLITVITKSGKITRYNLLDVQKMIIE